MPWLKMGDAAANHPIVLNAYHLDVADDGILNELFGFVTRCATQCAAYEQDYIVTLGTARQMAGSHSRFQALAAAAERCGYWVETTIPDATGQSERAFKLVEEKDLFHMILKAERAWVNKRKTDSRQPELYVPVRLRDGDACRYCGKVVAWGDTVSGRGGTYDHVVPGDMNVTVDTYVVCCRECNGRRQDDPDRTWKTLPPPTEPLYGPATVKLLAKHGVTVHPTYTRPPAKTDGAKRKGKATAPSGHADPSAPGPAVEDAQQAPSGPPAWAVETPEPVVDRQSADPQPSDESPALADGPDDEPLGDVDVDPPGPAGSGLGQRTPGPGHVGTGRDGTGQDGPGRAGAGAQPSRSPARRRRPRRRSRGRNTRPAQQAVSGEHLPALCDDHNQPMPCERCEEEDQ